MISCRAPAAPGPAVSLVIPVRNEERTIGALIESIDRQSVPPDEIVLVDGGSTDRTVELVRLLTRNNPLYRVLEAGPASPGRARNLGITAAQSDWIALTDAGITLRSDWLECLLNVTYQSTESLVVYGSYEPVTNTFFERCAALAYVAPKQARSGKLMRGPFIASSLIHRSVWQAVGGFPDLRASEDLIFMERVRQGGFKVAWSPSATVYWQLQPTLIRTFRKFVLYSMHNAIAGRQRDWHYGVARQYLVALPFFGLAATWSRWWTLVPILGFSVRVGKSIWQRREGRSARWLLNPLQFLGVGVILATLDAATFVGWARALRQRHRRKSAPWIVTVVD